MIGNEHNLFFTKTNKADSRHLISLADRPLHTWTNKKTKQLRPLPEVHKFNALSKAAFTHESTRDKGNQTLPMPGTG